MVQSTANSFISRLAGDDGESGLEAITIEPAETLSVDDPKVEIYNLQGIRVSKPDHGIYILRKGTKVTKVII